MQASRGDLGLRAAAALLAWLAGTALQLQQATLWPIEAHVAIVALALPLALYAAMRASRMALLLLCMALGALAFASTSLRAAHRLDQQLAPALEGRELLLIGIVDEMPQLSPEGVRFVLAVERAFDGQAQAVTPRRVSLVWLYGLADDGSVAALRPDLRAGQRWQLPVRLRRPHGAMNPHGFDGELWLFEHDIGATGSVRSALAGARPALLDETHQRPIERARQALRDAVVLRLDDARLGGVLAALTVGDQAAIARADWDLFRDSGVAHLMSISGLHITMFAWLAGGLVGWLWRRSARACLWMPAPQAGRWGGLLVATGYALLAGFGVPAQRTLLMLAAVVLLRSAGLRWPWPLVLLGVASLVVAFDPWALLQAGFWLSFAAVGLLMANDPLRIDARPAGAWPRVRAAARAQAVASLGLAPLSLAFFQQVSLVGLLANLIAIPWVTLLVTPLALLGVAWPWLWHAAAGVLSPLVALLQGITAWPGAVWHAPAAPAWAVACGLFAALLGLLPLPWRLRVLALPLVLPMLWPALARPPAGRFELVVLDVGQGTSVLVRTQSRLLVYDAGPAYSRDADAGQRIVVPLLRARGETRIDRLVLSHRDTDHVGGAESLSAALPIGSWHTSLADAHPLRGLAGAHEPCAAGQTWSWDGVRFEFLHPAAGERAQDARPNALSCVLRVVDAAGRSVLLAGDIEAAQEAALVARLGAALHSDMLLVPHHGSRTSSTDVFLDAVQPRLAMVQAGYRSRYGHPAAEVLARYQARGIMLVRSDRCGAWTWHDGSFECARDTRRRYWHWNDQALGAKVASPGDTGERRP
ncbi:MAG: DNA internalization-related competence protein ComEC/Rec2 [Burkholderiaceae bacterium]|nr:DNA internalization-related competence protein ComEC/Rec2 [Burkholderiaceae bacterium]